MYYFIADIKINDMNEYQKYLDKVDEIFSGYKGKYLVLDDNPKVLEGDCKHSRTVIISFDTEQDFNEWYYSKDYQEILKFRLNSAECDTILVKGKE